MLIYETAFFFLKNESFYIRSAIVSTLYPLFKKLHILALLSLYKFCRNGGFTTFDNLDIKLFIFQAPDIYIELK